MADTKAVQQHIKELEHLLNKDMSFVLHQDGSGCFETFFDSISYQHFNNQSELNVIISSKNLKPILDNE